MKQGSGCRQHPDSQDRNLCRDHYKKFLSLVQRGLPIRRASLCLFMKLLMRLYVFSSVTDDRAILLESQFNDHVKAIEKYRQENGLWYGGYITNCGCVGSAEGDPAGVCHFGCGNCFIFQFSAWRDYILTFTTTPIAFRLRYPDQKRNIRQQRVAVFLPHGVEGGPSEV